MKQYIEKMKSWNWDVQDCSDMWGVTYDIYTHQREGVSYTVYLQENVYILIQNTFRQQPGTDIIEVSEVLGGEFDDFPSVMFKIKSMDHSE